MIVSDLMVTFLGDDAAELECSAAFAAARIKSGLGGPNSPYFLDELALGSTGRPTAGAAVRIRQGSLIVAETDDQIVELPVRLLDPGPLAGPQLIETLNALGTADISCVAHADEAARRRA